MDIQKIKSIVKNHKPGVIGNHKYYAVMLLLVDIDGKKHILYEVRSAHISTQPREVSFPGGRIEGSETPKEAGIRETCEELGIESKDIEVIGELDKTIALADFTIYAFAGVIDKKVYEKININECEVSEIFLVPLEFFFENEPDVYTFDVKQFPEENFPYDDANISSEYKFFTTKIEVPIYKYKNKSIWGLTGRITRSFINMIKDNYK